jgi:hypothetical protein
LRARENAAFDDSTRVLPPKLHCCFDLSWGATLIHLADPVLPHTNVASMRIVILDPALRPRTDHEWPCVRLHDWNGISGIMSLLADPELADYIAVPIGVTLLQVVKQPAPLAHKHQQAATRPMVLLVCFEVFCQFTDAFAQYGDLDLRTPGV